MKLELLKNPKLVYRYVAFVFNHCNMRNEEKFFTAWKELDKSKEAFFEKISNIEMDFYPLYYYKAFMHIKRKTLKKQ